MDFGSILVLIHINDLPKYFENFTQIAMFAGDTSIAKASPQNQCNLQTDLDRLNHCFAYNKLSLNLPEYEVMKFGVGTRTDFTLTNDKLSKRNACEYLGVYLGKKLLFHDHIEYIVKKLSEVSGLTCKVCEIYPWKCLFFFYNSVAKSVFSYGLLTYRTETKTNLEKIDKTQRILRAIFFKNVSDSVGYMFEQNKVLAVFELFVMEIFREV